MRYVAERHIVIDDRPAPVPFWDMPAWGDRPALILGGGPSHVDVPILAMRRFRLIVVNSACRHAETMARPDDILYFADNSWSERFPHLIRSWPGLVVTSNRGTKARFGPLVHRLDFDALTASIGVLPDFVGASSGHTAACLSAVMGARRVVLSGFEGRSVGGRSHGHSDYTQADPHAFRDRFIPGWSGLAPAFARMGVEVLNATPHSLITDFPTVSMMEVCNAGMDPIGA